METRIRAIVEIQSWTTSDGRPIYYGAGNIDIVVTPWARRLLPGADTAGTGIRISGCRPAIEG